MVMAVNETYLGDFTMYTKIMSLPCTPETNVKCQYNLNKKIPLILKKDLLSGSHLWEYIRNTGRAFFLPN